MRTTLARTTGLVAAALLALLAGCGSPTMMMMEEDAAVSMPDLAMSAPDMTATFEQCLAATGGGFEPLCDPDPAMCNMCAGSTCDNYTSKTTKRCGYPCQQPSDCDAFPVVKQVCKGKYVCLTSSGSVSDHCDCMP